MSNRVSGSLLVALPLLLLMIPLAALGLPEGTITVEATEEYVAIDTPLLHVNFTLTGARPSSWLIKSTGVDLASGAGPSGPDFRYPLWDWLTTDQWPGDLWKGKYEYLSEFSGPVEGGAYVVVFRLVKPNPPGKDFVITKYFTFYPDKYYVDILVSIQNPTDSALEVKSFWGDALGYSVSWCGIVSSDDVQAWNMGGAVTLGKRMTWTRLYSRERGQVIWTAVYSLSAGAWGGIIPGNETYSLWLETGGWGTEVRVEFPAITIGPGEEVRYTYRAYGGPIDRNLLLDAGFVDVPVTLSLRAAIDYDKYAYRPGDRARVNVTLTNGGTEPLEGVTVEYSVVERDTRRILASVSGVSIPAGSTVHVALEFTVDLSGKSWPARVSVLKGEESVLEEETFLNVVEVAGEPIRVVFVWHHHQPIYLNPKGVFEQPWVQTHTGSDFNFHGEMLGAYLLHVRVLEQERFKDIRVTFNIQPSLVYQWLVSLEKFKYDGRFQPYQGDPERDLQAIREALEGYKRLVQEGRIQILTSPFYHPLSAIIVDEGWADDLRAQILMGKSLTDRVFGIDAKAMWTPEMGFNTDMVDPMNETGIYATVLDKVAFINTAKLEGGGVVNAYEPYLAKSASGKTIKVLFRDTRISNFVGFEASSATNPKESARELIGMLADIYRKHPGGIVTIALDGENPFIFGSPQSIYLLEHFYEALLEQSDWVKTVTLDQALAEREPAGVIVWMRESSWNTDLSKWKYWPSKDAMWEELREVRPWLVALTEAAGRQPSPVLEPDPAMAPNCTDIIDTLWNWLYIAEGSDWMWQAGEGPAWFSMQFYRYAKLVKSLSKSILESVSVEVQSPEALRPGDEFEVVLKSNASMDLTFNVTAWGDTAVQSARVTVPAGGVQSVKFRFEPTASGEQATIKVSLTSAGMVVGQAEKVVAVKSPLSWPLMAAVAAVVAFAFAAMLARIRRG